MTVEKCKNNLDSKRIDNNWSDEKQSRDIPRVILGSGLGSGSGSESSFLIATCAVTVAPCNLLSVVAAGDRIPLSDQRKDGYELRGRVSVLL